MLQPKAICFHSDVGGWVTAGDVYTIGWVTEGNVYYYRLCENQKCFGVGMGAVISTCWLFSFTECLEVTLGDRIFIILLNNR